MIRKGHLIPKQEAEQLRNKVHNNKRKVYNRAIFLTPDRHLLGMKWGVLEWRPVLCKVRKCMENVLWWGS